MNKAPGRKLFHNSGTGVQSNNMHAQKKMAGISPAIFRLEKQMWVSAEPAVAVFEFFA